MVVLNITTDADIANGTRGTVEGFVLDPREKSMTPDKDDGCIRLQYPPPVIHFKPYSHTTLIFEGVPAGIIPILPSTVRFSVEQNGEKSKAGKETVGAHSWICIHRLQSTGPNDGMCDCRHLETAIRSVVTVQCVCCAVEEQGLKNNTDPAAQRDFDHSLFMHHPSEDLRIDMERLQEDKGGVRTSGKLLPSGSSGARPGQTSQTAINSMAT